MKSMHELYMRINRGVILRTTMCLVTVMYMAALGPQSSLAIIDDATNIRPPDNPNPSGVFTDAVGHLNGYYYHPGLRKLFTYPGTGSAIHSGFLPPNRQGSLLLTAAHVIPHGALATFSPINLGDDAANALTGNRGLAIRYPGYGNGVKPDYCVIEGSDVCEDLGLVLLPEPLPLLGPLLELALPDQTLALNSGVLITGGRESLTTKTGVALVVQKYPEQDSTRRYELMPFPHKLEVKDSGGPAVALFDDGLKIVAVNTAVDGPVSYVASVNFELDGRRDWLVGSFINSSIGHGTGYADYTFQQPLFGPGQVINFNSPEGNYTYLELSNFEYTMNVASGLMNNETWVSFGYGTGEGFHTPAAESYNWKTGTHFQNTPTDQVTVLGFNGVEWVHFPKDLYISGVITRFDGAGIFNNGAMEIVCPTIVTTDMVNDGDLYVAGELGLTGVLAVQGALHNKGTIRVDGDGVIRVGKSLIMEGGSIDLPDEPYSTKLPGGQEYTFGGYVVVGEYSGEVLPGKVIVGGGGVFAGDGQVSLNVLVNQGGIIQPGDAPGVMLINGDLTVLSGAIASLQIGGGTLTSVLGVGGTVNLGGTLEVTLINDAFQPQTGDFISDLIFGSALNGAFESFTGTELGGGMRLNPISSQISFGLLAALPGDANLDTVAEFTDLGILLNNYNVGGYYGLSEWQAGDFNDDHVVDFVDLGILLNNYNQQVPALAPVPEPSTLALAAFGALGLLMAARRKLTAPTS